MESPHKGKTGFTRLANATRYSAAGLAAALRNEDAFRVELMFAAVMVPLGLWLGPGGTGKALLLGSVLLVLIVELLNSAIEAAVDRISLENHHLESSTQLLFEVPAFGLFGRLPTTLQHELLPTLAQGGFQ